MRQLLWMARGRWKIAAHLMAQQYNLNRDPKKTEEVFPDQLNPYARKRPADKPLQVPAKQWVGAMGQAMKGAK